MEFFGEKFNPVYKRLGFEITGSTSEAPYCPAMDDDTEGCRHVEKHFIADRERRTAKKRKLEFRNPI